MKKTLFSYHLSAPYVSILRDIFVGSYHTKRQIFAIYISNSCCEKKKLVLSNPNEPGLRSLNLHPDVRRLNSAGAKAHTNYSNSNPEISSPHSNLSRLLPCFVSEKPLLSPSSKYESIHSPDVLNSSAFRVLGEVLMFLPPAKNEAWVLKFESSAPIEATPSRLGNEICYSLSR